MIKDKEIRNIIQVNGMKQTPQRYAVLKALMELKNHPTAEEIFKHVSNFLPTISLASVYNTLNKLVDCNVVSPVSVNGDIVRYDFIAKKHHHLYSKNTGELSDYFDEELDELLTNYFKKKQIKNFEIEDIKIQIVGEFKER